MPKHSQNIYKYLRKRFEKKGITSDLFWSKTGRNEHVEQSNSLVRPSDVFKIFGKQNQSRAPENCEWRTENILFTDWNFKRWMFWTYAIFFGPCMCFSHDGQSVVVSTNGNTMQQTFWTRDYFGQLSAFWTRWAVHHPLDGQSVIPTASAVLLAVWKQELRFNTRRTIRRALVGQSVAHCKIVFEPPNGPFLWCALFKGSPSLICYLWHLKNHSYAQRSLEDQLIIHLCVELRFLRSWVERPLAWVPSSEDLGLLPLVIVIDHLAGREADPRVELPGVVEASREGSCESDCSRVGVHCSGDGEGHPLESTWSLRGLRGALPLCGHSNED